MKVTKLFTMRLKHLLIEFIDAFHRDLNGYDLPHQTSARRKTLGITPINETAENWKTSWIRFWTGCSGVELLGEAARLEWLKINQCVVLTAKKVGEKIEDVAEKYVLDAIQNEKENLLYRTAIFCAANKSAFKRTKRWFLFCPLCNTSFVPVCVQADNEETARKILIWLIKILKNWEKNWKKKI